MARKKLGALLVEAGVIDEMQLQSALGDQKKWGRPLGHTLVELGFLDENTLVQALSSQLHIPAVDLQRVYATPDALQRLEYEFCVANNCFPFAYEAKGPFLDVAMADPTNAELFDTVRVQTRCNVRPHIAGHRAIVKAIRRDYLGEMHSPEVDVDNRPWMSRTDEAVYDQDGQPAEEDRPAQESRPADAPAPRQASEAGRPDRPPLAVTARDHLLMQMHETVRQLVASLERDEKVLRKLMALMVEKGVCTRAELVAKIYED